MRTPQWMWSLAVIGVFSARAFGAQVVNVDLNSGVAPLNTQTNQGAFSTADAHVWNGLVLGSGVESATLLASDGSPTSVTFTAAFDGAYDIDSQGGAAPSAFVGSRPLLDDFVYNTSGSKAFSVRHLTPGGTYDLYLYGVPGGAGPRTTSFTVGATTLSTTGADQSSFVEGANYVRFVNLVADGSGTIAGTFAPGPGSGEADFNGLQIVEVVPEPTAGWAVFLAGGLLGVRRRTKA